MAYFGGEGDKYLKIREIDQELLNLLEDGKMEIKLTAVFENSCYGFYEDVLVTLLPKEKSLLPRSLTLEGSWKANDFKIGQVLSLGHGFYRTLRLYEGTKLVDLSLKGKALMDLAEKKIQIDRFLSSSKEFLLGIGKVYDIERTSGELSGKNQRNTMEMEIERRIQKIIQSIMNEEEILTKNIIGYGLGLTPSADDFLLGVLSVLEDTGQEKKRQPLKEYILKYYEETTEVSRYMLAYGAKSHIYPKFLQDFLMNPAKTQENFTTFLAHGSTSGVDLLAGVRAGIEAVMEDLV